MATILIPLLVISGPIGVGKTTVGNEVSTILDRRGVSHTLLDMDVLAETYPRASDDPFGKRLALLNLRDVWINCVAEGSQNLILPRVVETRHDLEQIQRAVSGSRLTVCQLRADDTTLIERVRARELGAGRAWHEARSLELARFLKKGAPADFVVDTDGRAPLDIAEEVVKGVEWAPRAADRPSK